MRSLLLVVALVLSVGVTRGAVQGEVRAIADGRATFALHNDGRAEVKHTLAAGTLLAGAKETDRYVLLRSAEVAVPANGGAEVSVPAAATNSAAALPNAATKLTTGRLPGLDPLLAYLATAPDVPAATAQLAVLCFTEDVTLAQWRTFLARQRAKEDPAPSATPQDLIVAVDALAILKLTAPDRRFALQSDAELKLRALRDPVTRPRAMQLYGLALPDTVAPLPPELGTLLHTKPGDNCPICRQRAQMLPREDGL